MMLRNPISSKNSCYETIATENCSCIKKKSQINNEKGNVYILHKQGRKERPNMRKAMLCC